MALLTRLLNKFNVALAKKLAKTNQANDQEIISSLTKLKHEHQFINIVQSNASIHNSQASYQTLILDINQDAAQFTIDEPFPKTQQQQFNIGDTLEISHRSSGYQISFTSQVLGYGLNGNIPAYQLSIPDNLNEGQQRGYFRVHIPLDTDIKLYVDMNERVMCSVLNLSSSGIGFSIPGNVLGWINKHKVFEQCLLEIPQCEAIYCKISVRSYDHQSSPVERTQIGGLLLNLTAAEQKKLDQYIYTVQRLQRQRQLGEL
jgi:c-di-GMP-binding flagellar brake protein YcgR